MVAMPVQYTLSGQGRLDSAWVSQCLNLFRQQQVNIRKLVLLHDHLAPSADDMGYQKAFPESYLEIHFALPAASSNGHAGVFDSNPVHDNQVAQGRSDFLPCLEMTLSQTEWRHRKLTSL